MVQSHTQQAETVSSQETAEIASPKMDPALRAKWIEALRSGEYHQGHGYLLRGDSYCCLGVLLKIQGCDITAQFPNLDSRMTAKLPREYNCGLTKETMGDLASRNDGDSQYEGKSQSFAEIADHIEQNL